MESPSERRGLMSDKIRKDIPDTDAKKQEDAIDAAVKERDELWAAVIAAMKRPSKNK